MAILTGVFPTLILLLGLSQVNALNWKYEYNGYEYFKTQSSSDDEYSWYAARAACMEEGGDILTIETDAENTAIYEMYTSFYGNLWIGLNSLATRGKTWEWADMKTSTLDKWYSSEPRTGEWCAYRSSSTSSYWYSENCGQGKGFMCKRKKGVVTPKTTPAPVTAGGYCPRGWIDAGTERCYRSYGPLSKAIRWSDAQALCKDEPYNGADLACANEQSEVSILSILGSQYEPTVQAWIGIHRSYYYTENWHWADNTPYTVENFHDSYSTYDDGCGFTSSKLKPAGSWDVDGSCTYSKTAYICQIVKDPNNVIPTPAPTNPNNCKYGYVPYRDSCYKILKETKSFDESKRSCESEQATLVNIHDGGENSVLQFLLSKEKTDKVWAGLKYNTEKHSYEWVNDWYVNFVSWGPNQPRREGNGDDCVSIQTADGNWYVTDCTERLPYICKTTDQAPITKAPDQPGRCPNNEWIPIGGLCYYACSTGCDTYWLPQQVACSKMFNGARLASIHDEVTNHILFQALVDDYYLGDAWLALIRSPHDRTWRWMDGTPLQYTNWATNEPPIDPDSDEHCAWMSLSDTSPGKWFAGRCENEYRGRLCELGKLANPTPPSQVNGSCPTNMWQQFGDQCYLFRPDEFASWNLAIQHCIKEGGSNATLAIIKTWPENDFIHLGMVTSTNLPINRNFWIGMARKEIMAPFEWIDGRNVTKGFTHWGPNQPSTSTTKHCGEVNIDNSMWHNQLCSNYQGYVCQAAVVPFEKNTPSPPSPPNGGADAGVIVGIIFGVFFGLMLLGAVGFIVFRHLNGQPVVNFSRFTNPTPVGLPAGVENPSYPPQSKA